MTGPAYAYDPDARPHDQRHQALTYADANGWLSFERLVGELLREYRYIVVTRAGVRRELTAAQVLPYVTGLADGLGVDVIPPPREDRP